MRKLTIAVSSRALFNLEDSNALFKEKGKAIHKQYHRDRRDELVELGVSYEMIKRLLSVNATVDSVKVEVVLLSQQDSQAAARCMNTVEKVGLDIKRAVFTCGQPTYKYLKTMNVDLYLSANHDDVKEAIRNGVAAAHIIKPANWRHSEVESDEGQLRIAFDGDSVLFDDSSDAIYRAHGEEAFHKHEREHADEPLPRGPFAKLLEVLYLLSNDDKCKLNIITALVTARSPAAYARALNTLNSWGIEVDCAMFLCGDSKRPYLETFDPHFYFDDSYEHCEAAAMWNIPTGHVPY